MEERERGRVVGKGRGRRSGRVGEEGEIKRVKEEREKGR